jgi:hypothetical protein
LVKSLFVAYGTPAATTAGATQYICLASGTLIDYDSTETNRQVIYRTPGTFSQLYVRVTASTTNATSTVRTRKNAATNGNLSVSIGAAATGAFEDTTNTDAVTAGDKWVYQSVSGGSGTMTISVLSILFNATTNTVTRIACGNTMSLTAASVSRVNALGGTINFGTATEASGQIDIRKAYTAQYLGVQVQSNARTNATTVKTRKNGADGTLTLSIGSTATGTFEDITHTDTLAVDDDYNYMLVTGSGTNAIVISNIGLSLISTGDNGTAVSSSATGATQTANTTSFFAIAGQLVVSTSNETFKKVKCREAYTFSQIEIYVSANTVSATSTFKLRKNGSDTSLSASITSNTTGRFVDNTNTVTTVGTDEVNLALSAGATGTSMVIRNTQVSYNLVSVSQVSQTRTHKYNILSQATKSKTHVYNIISKVEKTKTHKYNIEVGPTQVSTSKTHKFHVDTNTIKLVERSLAVTDIGWEASYQLTKATAASSTVTKDTVAFGSLFYWDFVSQPNEILKNDWENGNWILRFRVTTPNSNVKLTSYGVQRYSSDLSTFKASLDITGLNIPISSSGVYAFNLDWGDDSQNPVDRAEDDRIYIYFVFARISGSDVEEVTFGVNTANFSDEITTPIPLPTQVTTTKTHKYNILSQISKSKNHLYNIIAQASQTKTHKYSVLEALTTNKTHKYSIIEQITKAAVHVYNVIGKITAAKTHKYNIITALSTTKTHLYNIIEAVSAANKTHEYNIISSITLSAIHKYNIINAVSTTKTHVYDVEASITAVSTTKTHKYDVESALEEVQVSKTHLYNVIGKVTTSKTHEYHIIESVTTSKTHIYDVKQQITTTKSHNYDILEQIVVNKTHSYNVDSALFDVSTTKTHKYDVTGVIFAVDTTKTHIYSIIEQITATKTHEYNILEGISINTTHKYDLIGKVLTTKTHLWNITSKLSFSKTHIYNILEKVGPLTKTHHYVIVQGAQISKTHKYNVIGKVTTIKTHRYNMGGKVTVSKTHLYHVGSGQLVRELGGSTHALIRFPERIKILDIIANIQNVALANIEILPEQNIAIGTVVIAEFASSKLLTASQNIPRHEVRSLQILPKTIELIEHKAYCPHIAIEVLPLEDMPQIRLSSNIRLVTSQSINLKSLTQIAQSENTIIRVASDTEITPTEQTQIEALSNVKIPYNLSNQIIQVPQIVEPNHLKTLKTLIKLLKTDDLF